MKRSRVIDSVKYTTECKMFGIRNMQKVVDEVKRQQTIINANRKLERDYKKFGKEVV